VFGTPDGLTLMIVGNMWVQAGKYLPRKLCGVAYIHFAKNSGPVRFYGPLRHAELGGRDLIWQAACDKKENLFFTRRQALYEHIQPWHIFPCSHLDSSYYL